MCFNPYQYDQFTRDAAARMQGVDLPEMTRPAATWSGVFARLRGLIWRPKPATTPTVPAE